MNPVFKTYLQNSVKGFLLSLLFPFLSYFLVEDKSFIYYCIGLNILTFIPGYYRYKEDLLYQKKLKHKGLTSADLDNIAFVKKWEEIRKKGLLKYSLIDGGLFFGFAMSGVISVVTLFIKKDLMNYISADLSNMFNFIGYTYLAGSTMGIIIYRLLWDYKEQKFIRLTDPLH